ncbi:hypothetical protein AAVH_24726 [Aphelenchoides avenae]|nr:hypothetical protein AAVH_24724 [Aphelenchus avenae]KAH7708026.1 hypothetical protein AAVH_24726 [Aphelenchus avenae]
MQLLLSSENVLDVLRCLDFASLLALQRSGSAFYADVHCNLAILPRLRIFHIYLDLATGDHELQELIDRAYNRVLSSPSVVPHTNEFDYSMLRPFSDTVGTNFIQSAIISSSLGPMRLMEYNMGKAVEALPALKHIRELMFRCRCMWHITYDVDVDMVERLILSPLNNLQCLELFEVSGRTDWAFLRKDWALRLRSVTVEALDEYEEDMYLYQEIDASGQAEILGYCTDFVHLEKGKSKRLTITGWYWPEFLQRIITTVSECKDWLTVVVDGVPGFIGNDAGYARCDVSPEHPERPWSIGVDGRALSVSDSVCYSYLDGSHRVFVQNVRGSPWMAVTNNPFVTTWDDAFMMDIEGF